MYAHAHTRAHTHARARTHNIKISDKSKRFLTIKKIEVQN